MDRLSNIEQQGFIPVSSLQRIHKSTLQIRASTLRKQFCPHNITLLASQIKISPKARLLLRQLESLKKVTADLLHS